MLNSVSWAKSPKAIVTSARYRPLTRRATPPSTERGDNADKGGDDDRRAERHAEFAEGIARGERADAEERGVAERRLAGVPDEHVHRQREDPVHRCPRDHVDVDDGNDLGDEQQHGEDHRERDDAGGPHTHARRPRRPCGRTSNTASSTTSTASCGGPGTSRL